MERIKAFGVARLGAFALLAAVTVCLTACGEEETATNAEESTTESGVLAPKSGRLVPKSEVSDSKVMTVANQMAVRGQQLVRAIIAADNSGRYRGYAWPSDAAGRYDGTKPSNGPNMYQSFESTADYFSEALYLNAPNDEQRARKCVLKDCSKDDISFGEVDCAWYIAANVRQAASNTPVLVSRNVNVDVLCNTSGDNASVGADELLLDIPPFGKDVCVIVYKDGSVRAFAAVDVKMPNLVPGLGSSKLSDIRQGEDPFRFLP